ncbi:hypothetical protein LSAT2_015434 [Lamellibrachia satsuma]|nr:hypothetical protein LSAT2_015434 [Lamellibrachia satsuma]
MRTLSRLLVLLVVHGCVADTHIQDRLCTVANKQLCWDASSLKPLANLPNITWQQLMKYCRRYPAVRRCEKQLAWNCTITTEKVYAGLDEEHKFMCADNGKVYAKHVDCLSTADLQTSEAACYKELRNRAEDVVKRNSREFVARFCQHTETYIDCTKNAVNSFCGKEASLWAVELNERSLSPLMVYLQCRDWRLRMRLSFALINSINQRNDRNLPLL